MHSLNYQHLRYFWVTAREGSVTRASERLRLAPSTISVQIRTLEQSLGHDLFERRGRSLVLTEHGQIVKAYADDIFALGSELADALRSGSAPRHVLHLRVGLGNNLPKHVAYHLLSPAIHLPGQPVHLICVDDRADRLVADLALHHLDLVLADSPVGLASDVHAESVRLGACGIQLLATPELCARYRPGFPESLADAPMLLPDRASAMRGLLDAYFEDSDARPRVVAEFGDSALLDAFAAEGAGIAPVASIVADDVGRRYGLERLGELPGLQESFYALVMPGRMGNPAVQAVLEAAGRVLSSP